MLNAVYQHLYYILTFNHNGQGLKTSKGFTIILFAICLALSLIHYESVTLGIVIVNIMTLAFLYMITNKDVINGMMLCLAVFLIINTFFPLLSWIFFFWMIFAITKMQKNYRDRR